MAILDKLSERKFQLKIKAEGYYYPIDVEVVKNKLNLHFHYNPALLNIVKTQFEGRKWLGIDGGPKAWSIPITQRNIFRLEALQGKYSDVNLYKPFEDALHLDISDKIKEYCASRDANPYMHQVQMINQALIARSFIWAAEMGTGKTLAAIIAIEMMVRRYGISDIYWVGAKSALVAAKLDFIKWKTNIQPTIFTYHALRDLPKQYSPGEVVPQIVIFDEASRLKNPAAQQTQAAKWLAELVRQTHDNYLIGLLSGAPAPKAPTDWWSLCEIACPGFLKEGHVSSFKQRLALVEKRETVPGAGAYDHVVTWRDDDKKCFFCGMPEIHVNHGIVGAGTRTHEEHKYKASKNEVLDLKHRMRGLVGTWLKEDCLDLPAKRYEIIKVKPSRQTLNAAKLIADSTPRAITALTLLRELSDGFQYTDVKTGNKTTCDRCKGRGQHITYVNEANPGYAFSDEEVREGVRFVYSQPGPDDDADFFVPEIIERIPIKIEEKIETCDKCKGEKEVDEYRREIVEVACPKDEALIDLLERHEECGRLNIYGGFTGSIERIVRICLSRKWAVVRADGRGWQGFNNDGSKIIAKPEELMNWYMNGQDQYPWMAFVGQAGAAGMGLTLTVSPTTVFFSNDFNGESRMQAEDRGHRIGMDEVRGGLIVDIVHLKTDEKVLENLKNKKDLQRLVMKGMVWE